NEHCLRIRDRAPEIIARRGLQPSFVDREFVERKACREPRWGRGFSLPLVRLVVYGGEGIRCPVKILLLCCEQATQSSPAREDGVVFTTSDRQVAVGVLQDLDCFVPNFEKFCDQIALLPDIGLMRVGTPFFQASIPGIWVEDEEGIDKCDERA